MRHHADIVGFKFDETSRKGVPIFDNPQAVISTKLEEGVLGGRGDSDDVNGSQMVQWEYL